MTIREEALDFLRFLSLQYWWDTDAVLSGYRESVCIAWLLLVIGIAVPVFLLA